MSYLVSFSCGINLKTSELCVPLLNGSMRVFREIKHGLPLVLLVVYSFQCKESEVKRHHFLANSMYILF